MSKLKHLLLCCCFIVLQYCVNAQVSFIVNYKVSPKDISSLDELQLQSAFPDRLNAIEYINNLPILLQSKGYITASIDEQQIDSTSASIALFLGHQYKWAYIRTAEKDRDILEALRWNDNSFSDKQLNFETLQNWQQRILNYLEETGHPFAKIYLDSIEMQAAELKALLQIERGPVYKIDSIRIYGDAKLNNDFLQRYLDIKNGSIYNKRKLLDVGKKLKELTYVEETAPSNLSMLGTGSVLNVYLKAKKSSQINALIGFLPNSNAASGKKFLVTGEANILLKNALSAGETIGLNWQQLQVNSQRLHILYAHPYILKSAVGLNFLFEMFRKDSTFLNINMQIGANYRLSSTQSTNIFLHRMQSIVNGIDMSTLINTRRLPQEADVSSLNLGLTYDVNTTDYRFNPKKGVEFVITSSAGTKNVRKNNQILELKDPNDPAFKFESLYDTVKLKSYQFRVTAVAAKYFPLAGQSVIKTSINAGIYQSANIFRNELFQIGGYRLLRGFDEESQYVSQYAVATAEYRYLIGQNSNFFAFVDGGWAKHPLQSANHTYVGTGLGMAFETKVGIFNLAWAVGKRNDVEFNLRQSKLHFGFVNYF